MPSNYRRARENSKIREKQRAVQDRTRKSPVKIVRRMRAENYVEYRKALKKFRGMSEKARTSEISKKVQFLAIVEHIIKEIKESNLQDRKKSYLIEEFRKVISKVKQK